MKKNINRFTAIAGALVLIAAGFTGCSRNKSGSVVENPKEIHIRVWESKDGIDQWIKDAGKAYTKLHPNIIVDYVNVELHGAIEVLENDAGKGVGPDIIPAPHDNLGAIVEKKLIVPTENPEEISKQVLASCAKAMTYKNTMYGYPVSAETYALFYNKRLIKENEVPKTWEDLVSWVQKFNADNPGKLGFVMDVTNSYYSILFTTAGGNRLYGDSGTDASNPRMNTAEAVRGLQFFQGLKKSLGLENTELSTSACEGLFASGNAAMFITGLWNVKPFENAGLDFNVAAIPSLPGEKHPSASFSGTRGMFVTSCSKHPKEAADFAAFLLTPEIQQLRFQYTGAMPSINTTVDSKYMAGFLQQLDYAFPMPSIPEMSKFWSESGTALYNIWNGADVKTELDAMNSKIKG